MTDTMSSFEGDRVTTFQFNGQNFDTFKFSVNLALRKSNLIPIFEGTRLKPEPVHTNTFTEITIYYYFTYIYRIHIILCIRRHTTILFHQWLQTKHWLANGTRMIIWQCTFSSTLDSFNQEQQRSLLTFQTAHEIWISLTSRYQLNSTERKLSCVQEFLNYKLKPELCIKAHIESIKLIAQQTREAGCAIDDEEICEKILTITLPASLHYFRCSFESFRLLKGLKKT